MQLRDISNIYSPSYYLQQVSIMISQWQKNIHFWKSVSLKDNDSQSSLSNTYLGNWMTVVRWEMINCIRNRYLAALLFLIPWEISALESSPPPFEDELPWHTILYSDLKELSQE